MDYINWLGYALSFLVYLALLLLSLASKNKNLPHLGLIWFTVCSLFWAASYLIINYTGAYTYLSSWAESLRVCSTGIFLLATLTSQNKSAKLFFRSYSVISLLILSLILPVVSSLHIFPNAWIYIAYLGLTVYSLILLELLYRKSKNALWGLKPLILALGTLMIFDFIVFSDASLVVKLQPDMWLARGYLHAAIIPLILWSLKRSKSLGISIYISREMVFQSSLLLGAGLYLCFMALAGYYIKSIESQWTGMVQIIFVALAFTLMFALFISETLKRNIRVFLEKNFFANQFDYRAQWLDLTNQLNKPLGESADFYGRSLEVFIRAIHYDSGYLFKLKGSKLENIASRSRQENDLELDPLIKEMSDILIPYILKKHWVIDFKDYQHNKNRYPGLALPDELINTCPFHVVVPVYQQESLWGLVCMDNTKKEYLNFNWEIRDYMTVVTNQVGHYIFQHEANEIVTENAQFAAFSRMSAFVIHDLKNVLAQINMILSNAQKHKNNPEFIDDTFETLGYTKQRMEKMLAQLTNKTLEDKQTQSLVNLNDFIQNIINNQCQNFLPEPELIPSHKIELNLDTEKFSNVLYHLIDNAQQATQDSGQVLIKLEQQNSFIRISIKDTGCGMSESFIKHKLFKPFETTKGNAGMGIGAYDAKLYIEQIGGRLTVSSIPDKGTEFIIELPDNG